MGFITMSTPTVLGNSCTQYEAQCIGDTQRALFYTGMALLAVGIAGYDVSLEPFRKEQEDMPNDDDDDDDDAEDRDTRFLIEALPLILVILTGAIALPYIKAWSLAFGIPAICTALATLVFLTSWRRYRKVKLQVGGNPLTSVLREFRNELHSEDEAVNRSLWPSVSLWMAYIMGGIVSSNGNTYFIEQANRMNHKLGAWEVPVEVILLLYGWNRDLISLKVTNDRRGITYKKKNDPVVATRVAMFSSVLCCITAAAVEKRRLKVIRRNGLLDKPDEGIPMHISWLYPQYFLLSLMDMALELGVAAFYKNGTALKYMRSFAKGVAGVGFMGSVVSVYVVGQVSESKTSNNWFQFTSNRSRLDRYYWVLAALGSVSVLLIFFTPFYYVYEEEGEEAVPDNQGESSDHRQA